MLLIKAYKCRNYLFLIYLFPKIFKKSFMRLQNFIKIGFSKRKINSFEFIRKAIMRFVKNTILSSYFVNVITAFF